MTTDHAASPSTATRRPLAPAARRAAARMVIAANDARHVTTDPRIVAIAEGNIAAPAAPAGTTAGEQPAAEPGAVDTAIVSDEAADPTPVRTYTVRSGDTLWAIAEQFYGDGDRYPEIAEASGIDNPDLIQPGAQLTIPIGETSHRPGS